MTVKISRVKLERMNMMQQSNEKVLKKSSQFNDYEIFKHHDMFDSMPNRSLVKVKNIYLNYFFNIK